MTPFCILSYCARCLLFFFIHQGLGNVSNEDYVGERFTYYSTMLRSLSQEPYSRNLYSSCDYVDVCDGLGGIEWTNQSDIFPPFQVNTSMVAHKLVDGADEANEINEICFATNLRDEWENELRIDPYEALAWQYLGFSAEGTFSFYPLSNWSDGNDCPGTYDPRQRAWYLSAITGPINVVILIDISSSEKYTVDMRLKRQKEAARELLQSLNYWSFFNIGVYTDDVTFFGSNKMLRATAENIQRAKDFVNSTTSSSAVYVNVESVLGLTVSMIESSISNGLSSNCHTFLMFLASDHNDIDSTASAATIINGFDADFGKLVVLSYVFNFRSEIVDPVYEAMPCESDGFQRIFTSSAYEESVTTVLSSYASFLAATLKNENVRYSEIYEDALGLGELTTGTTPLYDTFEDGGVKLRTVVGVYGFDLMVSGLNNGGSISNDDIMAILASIATCPSIVITENVSKYFREDDDCEVQLDTVNYGKGGQHPLEENKITYDLIGAFGLVGSLALCLSLLACLRNNAEEKLVGGSIITVFHMSFGVVLVVYLLSLSWDDVIYEKYWTRSTMTVLSVVIDPSICCNVINCECANFYGDTCSDLVDNYDEGTCDNGYYCCRIQEYDCNCDDGGCDTCTRCIESVNNHMCEVDCNECYTGKVTWSYRPEESSVDVVLGYQKHCNLGNEDMSLQCAQDFVAGYPVSSQHHIIYNPLNWLETEEFDNDLPSNYYAVVISLSVCLSLSYWVLVALYFRQQSKDTQQSDVHDNTSTSQSAFQANLKMTLSSAHHHQPQVQMHSYLYQQPHPPTPHPRTIDQDLASKKNSCREESPPPN